MKLPPDYVELRSDDKTLTLQCRFAEGSPTLSGGVGGWEPVPRPGRRPLTVWRGIADPLTMTLPLLFDGYGDPAATRVGEVGLSVEDEIRVLERMGGLDKDDPEPPTVSVEGALPHDRSRAKQNRWVVSAITWGDAIRRPSDGHRVRQVAEVVLVLFTDDDRLERVKTSAAPKVRTVHALEGDTFAKIAARELDTQHLGIRLARLNDRRAGAVRVKLKKGTPVKLPSANALREWKRDLKRGR